MSVLRKFSVFALILILSFAAVSFKPRQAQAFGGAALTGGVLIGAAFAAPFVGAGMGYLLSDVVLGYNDKEPREIGMIIGGVFGAGFLIAGFIVLDGDHGPTVAFAPLSAAQWTKLGVTDTELGAYNDELTEVNIAAEAVAHDLDGVKSTKRMVRLSKESWEKYGRSLSPEAFAAVQKISRHAVTELQAQVR